MGIVNNASVRTVKSRTSHEAAIHNEIKCRMQRQLEFCVVAGNSIPKQTECFIPSETKKLYFCESVSMNSPQWTACLAKGYTNLSDCNTHVMLKMSRFDMWY